MKWSELIGNATDVATSEEKYALYYFDRNDAIAEIVIRLLLNEDRKSVDIGKQMCALFHKAHIPDGEDHLHFLVKGHKIASINKNGTVNDKGHGTTLLRLALNNAASHYPGFKKPRDGLIEQLMADPYRQFNEGFTPGTLLIPRPVQLQSLAMFSRLAFNS